MTSGSDPVKYVKVKHPKVWAVSTRREKELFKLLEERPISSDLVMEYLYWDSTPQGWGYWNRRYLNPNLVSSKDLNFIIDSLGYRIAEFNDDEWD